MRIIYSILLVAIFSSCSNKPAFEKPDLVDSITLPLPKITLQANDFCYPQVSVNEKGQLCINRYVPSDGNPKIYVFDQAIKHFKTFEVAYREKQTYSWYLHKDTLLKIGYNIITVTPLLNDNTHNYSIEGKPSHFGYYNWVDEAEHVVSDTSILINILYNKEETPQFFVGEFKRADTTYQLINQTAPVPKDYLKKNYYTGRTMFDVNGNNIYYAANYYDHIYSYDRRKNKMNFDLKLGDYIPNYTDHPFEDTTKDMQFLKEFFIKTPKIVLLRYDAYRKHLHVLVKQQQELVNTDGTVNTNSTDAAMYWLILDDYGDLVKKYELPKGKYRPRLHFTKDNVLIQKNEKDATVVSFDVFRY